MTLGTIHSLGCDLFAIEGRPPVPLRIVCRLGPRLYLIGDDGSVTGGSAAQSAAAEALRLSYPHAVEVVRIGPSAEALAHLSDVRVDDDIRIGATSWNGWVVGDGDVLGLRVPGSAERVVLYISAHRLVVLDRPAAAVSREAALGSRLAALVDSGWLHLVAATGDPLPIGPSAARRLLVEGQAPRRPWSAPRTG